MEILLVPGFMLDGDLWREIRPELERHGRVSDVDTSRDDSIDAMAERALLTMTGPAIVIGFSMGGYVARAMAYGAPEQVRGLALIATSSRGSTGSPGMSSGPRFQKLGRAAIAASLHPDHRTDALIDRVQQMSAHLGDDVFQRQSRMVRDDCARLGEIRCPTAIIAGAQDALRTIGESKTLQAGITGSALTIIDHSGHLIPIEQPDALLRALRPLLDIRP
jgi:pimeloyl-ACP methyl ester carboxylesterase